MVLQGEYGCFRPAVGVNLEIDVGDVAFDGARAEEQGIGNLTIALSGRNVPQ